MVKEQGVVIEVENDVIYVESKVTSSCNSCQAQANCGTSAVAKAFAGRTVVNKVKNHLNANVGDRVEIGIPESSIVQASIWLYLLPLISAIIAALLGHWLSLQNNVSGEWLTILFTAVGGGLGFMVSKKVIKNSDQNKYQVQLLTVLPEEIAIKNW